MGTKFIGVNSLVIIPLFSRKGRSSKIWKALFNSLEFYKDICDGLPCPYCKQHASNYVKRIPLTSINTKEKLKQTLFNFHNDVNLRTGKSSMHRSVLKKYKDLIYIKF